MKSRKRWSQPDRNGNITRYHSIEHNHLAHFMHVEARNDSKFFCSAGKSYRWIWKQQLMSLTPSVLAPEIAIIEFSNVGVNTEWAYYDLFAVNIWPINSVTIRSLYERTRSKEDDWSWKTAWSSMILLLLIHYLWRQRQRQRLRYKNYWGVNLYKI